MDDVQCAHTGKAATSVVAVVFSEAVRHLSEGPGRAGTYFDVDNGYGGLGLVEVACNSVHGLWNVIQHQIQIHFIFL